MKTDCCYFDPIYLCVKLVWLQQFGFSSMSKTKSIRNLVASPSTGEGKGEGAIRITPHPYLLPQGEKDLRKDVSAAVSDLSLIRPMQICWDQNHESK